jgi:peroxiredoxin
MAHAPDFRLADQDGKLHSLADYRGGWLVRIELKTFATSQ